MNDKVLSKDGWYFAEISHWFFFKGSVRIFTQMSLNFVLELNWLNSIIGSDNVLSPGRRQAIIWTNAGILLIGPLGTNVSEILIKIHTFSLKKMHLKMLSGKWQPFCLCLNMLSDGKPLPELMATQTPYSVTRPQLISIVTHIMQLVSMLTPFCSFDRLQKHLTTNCFKFLWPCAILLQ